jgi:single-strand DNA-binding protein
MPAGIARVVMVGRFVRDPEQKFTADQTEVSKFSVAVNERVKVDGEWQDSASFFDVTAFGHTAEYCNKYGARGRQVGIDGRLRQERWTDKDTGGNRSKVVVIAGGVQIFDRGASEEDGPPRFVPAGEQPALDAADDDIPF